VFFLFCMSGVLFCVVCVSVLFCVLFFLLYTAASFPVFVQDHRPLPPGGNSILVNKYHIDMMEYTKCKTFGYIHASISKCSSRCNGRSSGVSECRTYRTSCSVSPSTNQNLCPTLCIPNHALTKTCVLHCVYQTMH